MWGESNDTAPRTGARDSDRPRPRLPSGQPFRPRWWHGEGRRRTTHDALQREALPHGILPAAARPGAAHRPDGAAVRRGVGSADPPRQVGWGPRDPHRGHRDDRRWSRTTAAGRTPTPPLWWPSRAVPAQPDRSSA